METNFVIIIGILLFALVVVSYYNPDDNLLWCLRNKPMMNATHVNYPGFVINNPDERIQKYCYGELWKEYCKVSYPQDCP